jgi:hypothetical protein
MRKFLLFTMLMMVVNCCWGQAPAIQWAKCYGGSTNDYGYTIEKTNDGGYILAGETSSNDGDVTANHGGSDCWIVKLDSMGIIQWQKTYGGTSNDAALSIKQVTDGGYIVAAQSTSNDGDVNGHHGDSVHSDYWIIKLNVSGAIQWQKSFGGSNDEFINSILQTTDGGYIIAGSTFSYDGNVTNNHGESDAWVVKLNSVGVLQWQKTLGGSKWEYASSIIQSNDGGYIIAGSSYSNDGDVTNNHGGYDYWVVKLDTIGVIQWQKSLGGSNNDYAYSMTQTTDGGCVIAGSSQSNDGDVTNNHGINDYWVVKLDSIASIQWQKTLGGTSGDEAHSVKQTIDKGYIIIGYTISNNGDVTSNHSISYDYWVVKLDSTSTLQWQKCLGGTDGDYAYSVQQTTDEGYIIAGFAYSSDGDVDSNLLPSNIWVVKLSGTTGIEELPTSSITLFPNPTNGQVTIKGIVQPTIAVYNLMGQRVVLSQGNNEVSLAQLPSGMYLVQVFNKDMQPVKSEQIMKE